MSATLGYNSLKVEAIGQKVYVPDNDYARLMYYLSCVFTVIQYDADTKFSNYNNYYLLTEEEKAALIVLVLLFQPEIFLDAHVFIFNSSLVPYGYSNEFYKITDEKIGVHVNQEIFISGKAVRVLKIMACNENWLRQNYINPLTNINNAKKRITSYSNNNYHYNNNQNNNCCRSPCCGCFICFLVVGAIVIWVLLVGNGVI